MSAAAVVALWVGDDAEPASLAEFARVAAAAAAAGLTVTLLDMRTDRTRVRALPAETERHLQAVVGAGTPSSAAPGTQGCSRVREALLGATSVLRLASPRRSASPPLLLLTDAWLQTTPDDDLLKALREAGQVLRV